MGKFQIYILISLSLLASNVIFAYSPKVDFAVRTSLERDGYANIVVSMQAGTRDILNELAERKFSSRTERSQAVYDALTARARNSQTGILRFLAEPMTSRNFAFGKVQSLWISNHISVQAASATFVEMLASMSEISAIREDEIEHLVEPIDEGIAGEESINAVNQWSLLNTETPQAWTLFGGVFGAGITVASVDTGVRPTHNILRTNYQNDSYSWFDSFDGSEIADDRNGHGTHTVGTMVGTGGFGMAPQGRWIACKGLNDAGSGSFTSLSTCGQFLICPTRPDGTDPNCSRTPHIVNNSWGGAGGRVLYDDMIAAWHAAGIIPVFSAGNSGTNCGSLGGPGDRDVLGVGSTTSDDELSSFSSVGPTGTGSMKPEISAPGSTVMSADHRFDNTYSIKSGTSMAAPHVAGAIALLLSRRPELTYLQIKSLLQSHADREILVHSNRACSFIADNVFPNHHFGYGRLNVFKSLRALA